jgi:hypothetical protein
MLGNLRLFMFIAGAISAQPLGAATVPDGKIIVRVEDGATSRCINLTTDRITMHMRRLIVNKDIGIFTEDKTAAVIVSTIISGEEGGLTPKKVTFPRIYTVNVTPYEKGNVSLPIEEKLFSRFPLTNSGNSYDTAEVEFTVLTKKDKGPFGVALSALADISKSLPAPINPFSESFKYFSDYANKVVEGSLTSENNIGTQSKEGKMILSFSSTSTCAGDQEKTGTLAVVSGMNGKELDGFIDIKKDYCWNADLKPVFNLKFANKPTGATCSSVLEGTYKRVNNPYIAFYLNSEPKTLTSSQNAQVKTITLPNKLATLTKTNESKLEKSIQNAYDVGSVTSTPSTHTDTVKSVTSKVSGILNEASFFAKATEKSVQGSLNNFTLPTTVVDGLAIDLAESLQRCSANGIDEAKCF